MHTATEYPTSSVYSILAHNSRHNSMNYTALMVNQRPSPESCIFEQAIFDHIWSYRDQYLLTSKNWFIFVENCTLVVNFVKFPQTVCKTPRSKTFSIWSRTDAGMHGQPENRMLDKA